MATKNNRQHKVNKYTDLELNGKVRELDRNPFSLDGNGVLMNDPKELLIGGERTGLYIGKDGVRISGGLDVSHGALNVTHDSTNCDTPAINGDDPATHLTGIMNNIKQKKTVTSNSAVSYDGNIATKKYVDDNSSSGGATTFQLEDGDGTEVTIAHEKEVKFVASENIDINWTDVSTGSDADPYDLTFIVKIPFCLYSNFQDDVGTSKHYLPLRDIFEQSFIGTEQTGTIAPFNMTLQKVVMRSNTDLSGATWTLGMWAIDSGTTEAHHHTTGKNWVTATGGAQYANAIFDFTGTVGLAASASGGSNAVTAGQWIDFQLVADTDVTSSSSEFWFTFLFHADMGNTI